MTPAEIAYADIIALANRPENLLSHAEIRILQGIVRKHVAADPVINAVIEQYVTRSNEGMVKYGVSMTANPLELREWLEHAKQECMDMTAYIHRAIDELKPLK
jgi:hypothetical protein